MTGPLNDAEWSKFWEYLSIPQLPADQMSPEQKQQAIADHAEFAALHEKAQAYIDNWQPDAKAVTAHLVGVISHFVAAIETLANILPAAGNLLSRVPAMKTAVESLTVALRGPAEIPPLPPVPGDGPDWPSKEQSAGMDPGADDGANSKPRSKTK